MYSRVSLLIIPLSPPPNAMRALSALQLLLFLLGLASLVNIPEHLVQNVYVDENSLMPNGAWPQITAGSVEFHEAAVALQTQLARASAEKCVSEEQ